MPVAAVAVAPDAVVVVGDDVPPFCRPFWLVPLEGPLLARSLARSFAALYSTSHARPTDRTEEARKDRSGYTHTDEDDVAISPSLVLSLLS